MTDPVRQAFEAWCRSPDGVLPIDALPIEWDDDGLEPFVYRNDGTTGRIGLECEWAAWKGALRAQDAAVERALMACAVDAYRRGVASRPHFDHLQQRDYDAHHASAIAAGKAELRKDAT